MLNRRSLLLAASTLATSSLAKDKPKPRMPVLFLAHGSPQLLDDAAWVAELHAWAKRLPTPKAILMLSAHWEQKPFSIGATTPQPLLYDFSGFPARYYRQTYAAPPAPALAARVWELVGNTQPITQDAKRGLDHGAYVPLVAMYPKADVPVLQVSLPSLDPRAVWQLGQTLAPLRDEGVLIIGSGFLIHNLRLLDFEATRAPPWASEFDHWAEAALQKKDVDAMLDYRRTAPGVGLALPTHEHFVPVLAALGAAASSDVVSFPITGFMAGAMTRRSVQFG